MRTARLRRDVFSLCVSTLLLLATGAKAQTGVIDPRLEIMVRCAAPDEPLAVIVRFHDAVDVRDSALRQAFKSLGASDIRVLWIIHSIAAKVPAQAISQLTSLAGVVNIRLDEPITLPPGPGVPKPAHFAPPFTVELGIDGVRRPLIADVNGQGVNDVLIPYLDVQGTAHIRVYFGEGARPFKDRTRFFVGSSLGPVRPGDFNGDKIVDLVVSAQNEQCGSDLSVQRTLPVFLGHGDGTFQRATCLAVAASPIEPRHTIGGVVVADFNQDGQEDIAVSRRGEIGSGEVETFFGRGDGRFLAPRDIAGLKRPGALYAEDFNGDGHTDLLVVDSGRTSLYAGDEEGDLSLLMPGPQCPVRMVGDINKDSQLDLLVYHREQDTIIIFLGKGDGSFAAGQGLASGVSPLTSLQFADLNGDTHQDLIFVSESPPAVHVFLGNSSGRFIPPAQVIPVVDGTPPIYLAVDDLNNDNRTDLFVLFANAGGQATATVLLQTVENPADTVSPSVPTGVMATDTTQTTVTLAWQASTDDVGVTGYRLYEYVWINRFVSHWVLKLDGLTTLAATVTDLKPGVPHTYAVTAVDAAGNESARSVTVEVKTLQPPTAYHPIHGSNEEVLAIVGEPFLYNVDALGHPAPTFSLVAGPAGMSVDAESGMVRWTPAAGDEGIVTATVRATNSQGSADHTFSVRVHPAGTDLIPPSTVRTAVATNITAHGCTLTWQAASDNVGVAGYLIMAQQLGRGESLFVAGDTAGPGTTHAITTLQPGTGYRLWVAAYDAAGNRATISGLTPTVIYTLAAAQ